MIESRALDCLWMPASYDPALPCRQRATGSINALRTHRRMPKSARNVIKTEYISCRMTHRPLSNVFSPPMSKPPNRTVTTTFRTQPGVRDALERAAGMENRSMSNLIERLAIEYCRGKGIPIRGLDDDDPLGRRGSAAT